MSEDLHHELGPSGAARWMTCTKSAVITRGMADTSNADADLGTLAHSIAAEILRQTLSHPQKEWHAWKAVTRSAAIKDLGAENIEPLQKYVDYVLERAAATSVNPLVMVENTLKLDDWIPGGFGTGDCIIYNPTRKAIIVIDLKFGEGIMVYCNERVGDGFEINPQLGLYGLGAYKLTDFLDVEEVELVIHQPRREHVSAIVVSVEHLLAFGVKVRTAVKEIDTDPQFRPSEKACQWCKVKATCKARADWALELYGADIGQMTPQQVGEALARVDAIKSWCSDLEEHAMQAIQTDRNAIPGWKLVAGRGQRTWNHLAANVLEQRLGANAWDKKLIGITAAEKLLGTDAKSVMPSITVKSDGKPTLAPDSDPRSALSDSMDGFTAEGGAPAPADMSFLD